MRHDKKLSIIIPHYNSFDKLGRLLRTIPNANEVQIIVVDDKSDDVEIHSQAILKQFPYIEFVRNNTSEKNAGICRNIGLQYAVGQWILFADADDYFVEDFYKIVKPYFIEDADIVYFIPTSVYEGTEEVALRHKPYEKLVEQYLNNPTHENELLLRYVYVSPCSKLIRREVIVKNRVSFDSIQYSNDVMFSIKAAFAAHEIESSRQTIYVITQGSNTLTTSPNVENFKTRLNVFIKYNAYLKEYLGGEDYRNLNIIGLERLLYVLKNHMGWKLFVFTINQLRVNKIPIITWKTIYLKCKKIAFRLVGLGDK